MHHDDYYFSEKWKEIKNRTIPNTPICSECGRTDDLTVHHKNYNNFGGDETSNDLVVLCFECHIAFHESEDTYWIKTINQIEAIYKQNSNNIAIQQRLDSTNNKEIFCKLDRVELNQLKSNFRKLLSKNPTSRNTLSVIENLKNILQEKLDRANSKFLIIHNCGECINCDKTNLSQFKCKVHGKYNCYPGHDLNYDYHDYLYQKYPPEE